MGWTYSSVILNAIKNMLSVLATVITICSIAFASFLKSWSIAMVGNLCIQSQF